MKGLKDLKKRTKSSTKSVLNYNRLECDSPIPDEALTYKNDKLNA